MQHTTAHHDKNTKGEIIAIQILNADLNRIYPNIDHSPTKGRSGLVTQAMRQCSNPFQLCRFTVRLARITHNPICNRMPVTITRALQRIAAAPNKKPSASIHAERLTA